MQRPDQPNNTNTNNSRVSGHNRANAAGGAPSRNKKGGKKLKQDRTNKKRRETRRRATDRAWYVLVRGLEPGIYKSWEAVQQQIADSVAAGVRDPRVHRCSNRMEALVGVAVVHSVSH